MTNFFKKIKKAIKEIFWEENIENNVSVHPSVVVYDWSIKRRNELDSTNNRNDLMNSLAISEEFMEWDQSNEEDDTVNVFSAEFLTK